MCIYAVCFDYFAYLACVILRDTPVFWFLGVFFLFFWIIFVVFLLVFGCVAFLIVFLSCFQHADVLALFQWFWLVDLCVICFWACFGVSLSLAAQRGWFSSVEVDEPAGVVVV